MPFNDKKERELNLSGNRIEILVPEEVHKMDNLSIKYYYFRDIKNLNT